MSESELATRKRVRGKKKKLKARILMGKKEKMRKRTKWMKG